MELSVENRLNLPNTKWFLSLSVQQSFCIANANALRWDLVSIFVLHLHSQGSFLTSSPFLLNPVSNVKLSSLGSRLSSRWRSKLYYSSRSAVILASRTDGTVTRVLFTCRKEEWEWGRRGEVKKTVRRFLIIFLFGCDNGNANFIWCNHAPAPHPQHTQCLQAVVSHLSFVPSVNICMQHTNTHTHTNMQRRDKTKVFLAVFDPFNLVGITFCCLTGFHHCCCCCCSFCCCCFMFLTFTLIWFYISLFAWLHMPRR